MPSNSRFGKEAFVRIESFADNRRVSGENLIKIFFEKYFLKHRVLLLPKKRDWSISCLTKMTTLSSAWHPRGSSTCLTT